MFFKKKMELVYAEKVKYEHALDVYRTQIQHFRDFDFEPPVDVDAELERGKNLIRQFESIRIDKSKNIFERAERKSMLLGFGHIFATLSDDLKEEVFKLSENWNEQFHKSYEKN
ncbi:hypothetical protein J6W91_03325 [Candidatus Saccharibacteria bacterium]|nr:hypothetical protein [Candidatus Saccharibacteria bacterium]